MRIAVVGGGIAGVTAAWQLAQFDRAQGGLEVTLFEASGRLGGTVETVLRDGFVIECGPDGWVTEKPWAQELARELGLHGKLIGSNDAERVTWIVQGGRLAAMPDGMRMMVPVLGGEVGDEEQGDAAEAVRRFFASRDSSLFSRAAIEAYAAEPGRAAELRETAPAGDESIASFVRRHFGDEVLERLAAPLLSGVFGGEVARLSVRAVMPGFVRMEREFGSLILGLQAAAKASDGASIFTSLEGGTQALIDRMAAELPPNWMHLSTPVTALRRGATWQVNAEEFDAVILATPAHVTRELLGEVAPRGAELLAMEASSAVLLAFAFTEEFALPRGFGFLAPAGEASELLAGTFVDQKYAGRVPESGRLLRAFFGGEAAARVAAMADEEIARLARTELEKILGPLPEPAFHVVRRWPLSLPQYGVGHGERMAELEALVRGMPGIRLVGNAYRGVGLPDLVRDGRAASRELLEWVQ